jgi:hypothetical protein
MAGNLGSYRSYPEIWGCPMQVNHHHHRHHPHPHPIHHHHPIYKTVCIFWGAPFFETHPNIIGWLKYPKAIPMISYFP